MKNPLRYRGLGGLRSKAMWPVLCLGLAFGLDAHAQEVIESRETDADGSVTFLRLDPKSAPQFDAKAGATAHRLLKLGADDELRLQQTQTDELGFTHERYSQYYRGVLVEGGTYLVHARQQKIESLNGHLLPVKSVKTVASLDEATALSRALANVHATQYKWEVPAEETWLKKLKEDPQATFYPKGTLLIINDEKDGRAHLTYKFTVYAQQPASSDYIYVDAHTGEVVRRRPVYRHNTPGTADTRHSGQRTITTTAASGGYVLRETGRGNSAWCPSASAGANVETYNMQQGADRSAAVDYVDNDNNWTAAEHNNATNDNAALEVHWASEGVVDYFSTVHCRNSFDGQGAPIRSYVNADLVGMNMGFWNNDNAFWDEYLKVMTYGAGTYMGPIATLDIVGHEIGHGLCQHTANLEYWGESGALNEGLSDIWGACVEQWNTQGTKSTWLIGEEAWSGGLRSMSDPKSKGNPAYYQGQYWSSNQGAVHTNSGVLGHWFYLLAAGGSGTNEAGNSYCVARTPYINDAARIVYRMETVYLSRYSNYNDARLASLQAAQDLFGANSAQYVSVANAWYAVGLGSPVAYVMNGPEMICPNTSVTYTATASNTGVVWQASPANLFTTSSGYGTSFTTASAPGAAGFGTITATYINSTGCVQTLQKRVNVNTGAAIVGSYRRQGTSTSYPLANYSNPALSAGTYEITLTMVNALSYSTINATFSPWSFQDSNAGSAYNSNNNTKGTIVVGLTGGTQIQAQATSGCTSAIFACRISSNGTQGRSTYAAWPNPVNDVLTIEPSLTDEGSAGAARASKAFTVRLLNTYGVEIKTQRSAGEKMQLSTAGLREGLYILQIRSGEETTTQHIQVTH